MNKETKWIWIKSDEEKDVYAEFKEVFDYGGEKQVVLKIACDGIYSVYLNDEIVAFSACADYPTYKFFDEVDITAFCKKTNELKVQVWHMGVSCFNYIADAPGVIFEVSEDRKVLVSSNSSTPARIMSEYKNGYCKAITEQVGLSFLYDNTAVKKDFGSCEEVKKTYNLHKRPIKQLKIEDRLPVKIIRKKNSVIIDMKKEVAGFIDLDFVSTHKQKILFTYGEHIKDGGVRQKIGDRDFSVEFIAKRGNNKYLNPFRRLAGRYIEIFSKYPIDIKYIGIRPVFYPTTEKKVHFADELTNKIYKVSVDTMKLCMHEHYEDTPWREQSLYVLDSRNQMLYGYKAFENGNIEYARHNIVLISKSIRKDGLLCLCAVSGSSIAIPFFSLCYILQVYEYVLYTKDKTILNEVGGALKKIVDAFSSRIETNNLIAAFPYNYWNFYEWEEDSHNGGDLCRTEKDPFEKRYDLILNCAYVYTVKLYDEMFNEKHDTEKIKKAIKDTFYNGRFYKLSTASEKYSQFGNAMAILAGLGDKSLADRILKVKKVIPASLSVRPFLYDALLGINKNYKKFILEDIKTRYKKMLDEGATSFWETEKGSEDFGGAGSLCHAWSSMPVYYFHLLLTE